jgi:phosphatidylglycerol:prolipoprotein diacylglycerol transferase
VAFPYIAIGRIEGLPIQPYGILVLLGLGAGAFTAVRLAKRFAIPGREIGLMVPLAIGAAIFGAHIFDVVFYQWERAMNEPGLWLRVYDGVSLFGGLLGVMLTVLLISLGRRLHMGLYSDIVAVGVVAAMIFGRLGCALVHDHPGLPTPSPIGVDMPVANVQWALGFEATGHAQFIRVHDLGLEELMLVVPLFVIALLLVLRRLRAGMAAAIVALTYAAIRFGLDFLRLPKTDPKQLGLTASQWGCIAMAVLAITGFVFVVAGGRIAPIRSELDGRPGGYRNT